jgi:hypothetical protein
MDVGVKEGIMRCRLFRACLRLALGLLALLLLAPAWAADPVAEYEAIKRASLKGIESLNVVVLAAKLDSACHRVSDEDIETEVEARLERAGIPLAPDPVAYLFVSLASVEPLKDLLCGFVVSVEVQHVVRLVRDMRIMTFGMTWHRGGLGFASTSRTANDVRRLLAALVDEFITVYLEQNPKP